MRFIEIYHIDTCIQYYNLQMFLHVYNQAFQFNIASHE